VVFKHNDYSSYYTKSFYRGETVRLAVPEGIYDNNIFDSGHGSAVLMAGHRGLDGKLRLLAWGILTGVYDSPLWDRDISTGSGQKVTVTTGQVEFTLIGLEYEPYSSSSAPTGFQIMSPPAWQQISGTNSLANNYLTVSGLSKVILYYPLPAQALGDTDPLTFGGQDYWSRDINGNGNWYDDSVGNKGNTSDGANWSTTNDPTSRPNGNINDVDMDDVITARFLIKNLPDKYNFPALINKTYVDNTAMEVHAIPVVIPPDPGIPIIAEPKYNSSVQGQLFDEVATGTLDAAALGGSFTGDIHVATKFFEVDLKTYPLPDNKPGGWALVNARIYVQALTWASSPGSSILQTWAIETGSDLYAIDESSLDTGTPGGSILCAIGIPRATSVSSGFIVGGTTP
jgi:hypothetical protein